MKPRCREHNPSKGFALALGGLLVVSTNFVTAKYGVSGFDPHTFSFVWTSAAAFYATVLVIFSGRSAEIRLPREAVPSVLVLGLCTGVLMVGMWSGLQLLNPSFAAFLVRFTPVLTILLGAIVLGERLQRREILAMGIMIAGGVLCTIGRWEVVGLGTIFILIGCCAAAVQQLMAKLRALDVHPSVLVFYRLSIGAVLLGLWVFGSGKADFQVAPRYWIVTCIGAFLGPFFSYVLTYRSYHYWELSRTSIVRSMQPLVVIPMAWAAFRELPATQEITGGLLILIGSVWMGWIHLGGPRKKAG